MPLNRMLGIDRRPPGPNVDGRGVEVDRLNRGTWAADHTKKVRQRTALPYGGDKRGKGRAGKQLLAYPIKKRQPRSFLAAPYLTSLCGRL